MAICAVSWSRISPTRILSGSWRRMERRPRAKVRPFFSLTGIWVMPRIWYSTGSSMVMILSSSLLISLRAAYSVVVLPLPVGPVTRTIPYGSLMYRRKCRRSSGAKPTTSSVSFLNFSLIDSLSSTRSTAFSPCTVGMMETRKSISLLLWHTPLCDVQLAHHLDARHNRRMVLARNGRHRRLQHAVDAVFHQQGIVIGFDMDVRCAPFESGEDRRVHQPDDRRNVLFRRQLFDRDVL